MKHTLDLLKTGEELNKATKALVMVHGRGGSAVDIVGLAPHLSVDGYAVLAPQATNNSWYPHSFMVPTIQNEPWLTAALQVMEQTVQQILDAGIDTEHIYFFGFSQGACLTLEFLARNARKYGGAAAIIGGLAGETIQQERYHGDFGQMPILLATSHPDFHVPQMRVHESAEILRGLHADVTEKIYEHAGHTILQEEIDLANRLIFR